jgi:protein TonB
MSGASPSVQPRFALTLLLGVCLALGGTGCATASRATLAAPPPEPVAVAEPVSEPAPAPAPAKAERPKAKRSTPKPPAEVKAPPAEAKASASESRTPVSARTPELKRPQSDGSVLGATASEPVPFEPSAMTRPQRVSGREPRLTEQARAERVRGTALVRCVVRRDGRVTDCKLLNGLPHMDQELLEAVSTWHVTPATAQGRPVDVEYTFVVRIPAS